MITHSTRPRLVRHRAALGRRGLLVGGLAGVGGLVAEDAYARAREAHPAFAGKTVTYCWPIAPDYYAYDDTDPRVQVVLDLGLGLTATTLES